MLIPGPGGSRLLPLVRLIGAIRYVTGEASLAGTLIPYCDGRRLLPLDRNTTHRTGAFLASMIAGETVVYVGMLNPDAHGRRVLPPARMIVGAAAVRGPPLSTHHRN